MTSAILIPILTVLASARGLPGGVDDTWGPLYDAPAERRAPSRHPPRHGAGPARWVRHWNEIAINATGLDHTPVAPSENRVFGEQFGPGRSSRAMAIVHLAVFDAVNAIAGGYESYTGLPRAPAGTSMKAAIAQAAHDSLAALFASQAPSFDAQLEEDLGDIRDVGARGRGTELGHRAAAAILALRADDGSEHAEARVGVDFLGLKAYLDSINWKGFLVVELDTSPWRPPKESARITAEYIRNKMKIDL